MTGLIFDASRRGVSGWQIAMELVSNLLQQLAEMTSRYYNELINLLLALLEAERDAVDAVALVRGCGVSLALEDVAGVNGRFSRLQRCSLITAQQECTCPCCLSRNRIAMTHASASFSWTREQLTLDDLRCPSAAATQWPRS